jgi:hypothetical protein
MMSGPLLALNLLLSLASQAEALDPVTVLAGLELNDSQVAFTETRSSGLLAEPLVVRGTFWRDADGLLIRETVSPRTETQILGPDFVELRRARGSRRRFSLERAPELAALRTVLLALLDGQPQRLAETFDLTVAGEASDWRLTLVPKPARLAERIEHMTLAGQQDRLTSLTLQLSDGDQVHTRFETGQRDPES